MKGSDEDVRSVLRIITRLHEEAGERTSARAVKSKVPRTQEDEGYA